MFRPESLDAAVPRRASEERPVLSVLVPAYNEAATIGALLDRVAAAAYEKQIVVVDDGSTDGTVSLAKEWAATAEAGDRLDLLEHGTNRGKGAAIRTGLEAVRGEVTVIQDADLEYDPADYPALVEPILRGEAEVVYGSRYLRGDNRLPWTANRLCVHLLNGMVRLLYGERITDEATCYKAFRTVRLREMDLQCRRFEFCPEATAKSCRMGLGIREVPIRYEPRTKAEGKKIGWRDGLQALGSLLYWRVARFRPRKRGTPAAPRESAGPG